MVKLYQDSLSAMLNAYSKRIKKFNLLNRNRDRVDKHAFTLGLMHESGFHNNKNVNEFVLHVPAIFNDEFLNEDYYHLNHKEVELNKLRCSIYFEVEIDEDE